MFLQQRWQGQAVGLDGADVWHGLQQLAAVDIWTWLVLLDDADDQVPREVTDVPQRRAWLDQLKQTDGDTLAQLSAGWLPAWNDWLAQRVAASEWSASERDQWLNLQNQRPPLWLRLARGHEDAARRSLAADGFRLRDGTGAALAMEGAPGLEKSQAWLAGWVEIQDRGSQAIAESVAARAGEHLWDVCAGAGGKTLALLDDVQPNGAVLATDIRPGALEQLRRRARRLNRDGLTTAVLDAADNTPEAGPFDAVLVDAPCTGAGTWRRSPDARWRLTGQRLAELLPLQQALLNRAAGAVRPGGRLVYATCSWLVAENEDRVAAFVAEHPEFELRRQGLVGAPAEDADTLFVAVLQRR